MRYYVTRGKHLVTLHLAPGQTIQELIGAIRLQNGGTPVQTVTGRAGVLVDAGVAYRYLAQEFAFAPEPVDEGVSVATEAVVEVDTLPPGDAEATATGGDNTPRVAADVETKPSRPRKAATKTPKTKEV